MNRTCPEVQLYLQPSSSALRGHPLFEPCANTELSGLHVHQNLMLKWHLFLSHLSFILHLETKLHVLLEQVKSPLFKEKQNLEDTGATCGKDQLIIS